MSEVRNNSWGTLDAGRDPALQSEPRVDSRPFRTAGEWGAHLRWRTLTFQRPSLGDRLRDLVGAPIDQIEDFVFRGSRTTVIDQLITHSFRALNTVVQRSRDTARVLRRYQTACPEPRSLAEVRALPIDTIDAARPAWRGSYDIAAAVGGGLGGFFGAPGSLVTVPALFATSLHAIGTHALHHGHDLAEHDEQEFAVTLLAASLVSRPVTRRDVMIRLEATALALETGSRDDIDEHRVAILENVAEAVVLRILLGLAVRGWPGVGLLLGAGFSRAFVAQVCETALAAYGQRWLFRHHGDAARLLTTA